MPRTLYYRGDVHLMEIMTKALNDQTLPQNLKEDKKLIKSSKKKRKVDKMMNKNMTSSVAPFRSDQFYKIPFCVHGSFSKKLGVLNTELQLMRSNKDTIIFLLWNDDIYFPSQTLVIVGSLAKSIQTKTKDSGSRDGFCVLELTENGLLDGFVIDIELGDGFLLIQTREHTLYGLGDDTIDQLGIGSKNHFYHEITEIPFEHGQIDFIRCGLTYSVAYTKSKEIYITGEYEYRGHSTWTPFTNLDQFFEKNTSVIDFQPGYLGMYCLTSNPSDVTVHNSYVFDWYLGSIRRSGSGYFQELQNLLLNGLTIQRIESCYECFAIQLDTGIWYWMHFSLTNLGSFRECFLPFKKLLPLDENVYQYEIQNVCGNKSENSFLVVCKIISADTDYDVAMEPYKVFICNPVDNKMEKIQCPFYGRSKWSISNPQITQYFSIITVNEEPSEWFMKRLISCEKWRDVTLLTN